MRYLGYRDAWENCYFSHYGKDKSKRFGDRTYCENGKQYYTEDSRPAPGYICDDWYIRCKGCHEVMKDKKFPESFGKMNR